MTDEKTIREMNEFVSEEYMNLTKSEGALVYALELVQRQLSNYDRIGVHPPLGNIMPDEMFYYFERLEHLIDYVLEHVESAPDRCHEHSELIATLIEDANARKVAK